MKTLPKTCITCKHAGFADDDAELKVLRCFNEDTGVPSGLAVDDDDTCRSWALNKSVAADAKEGCW